MNLLLDTHVLLWWLDASPSLSKIDTVEGHSPYSKRPGIVEPVFGNTRAEKRLDRFRLRGRIRVNIQWMLYCLVHNIEKVLHFGKSYTMGIEKTGTRSVHQSVSMTPIRL